MYINFERICAQTSSHRFLCTANYKRELQSKISAHLQKQVFLDYFNPL